MRFLFGCWPQALFVGTAGAVFCWRRRVCCGLFMSRVPLARLNTSDDVAAAAVWLASDEAFVTGENVQVNGGLTMRGNPQSDDIHKAIAAGGSS